MKSHIQVFRLKQKVTSLALAFLVVVSCQMPSRKMKEIVEVNSKATVYQPPEIPLLLNTPAQKASYLVTHFWNNFNFNDTSQLTSLKLSEQAFANFVSIAGRVSPEQATVGIRTLMLHAEVSQKSTLHFLGLAEKYLFNPNSPMRNELLYELFLEIACTSKLVDATNKIRYQRQYQMTLKNKPGNKSADFNFTLKNGEISSLNRIKSKLLLLYFYNPECNDCQITRDKIKQSGILGRLGQKGVLRILAVYPELDLTLWARHYTELPASWINGYNKGSMVQKNEIYDLKAIPTIYLLDETKTVLLRDATVEAIEKYLLKFTSSGIKTTGKKRGQI